MTVGGRVVVGVCKERLERTLRGRRGKVSSLRWEQMADKMAFSRKTVPVVGMRYPADCWGRCCRASGGGDEGEKGKGVTGEGFDASRERAPSRKQPPSVVELSRA